MPFWLTMTPSAGALNYHDAPDIVMVLLLIAMDPSSSNDLKRDVMTAMDTICQSIKDSGTSSATVRCSPSYVVLMLTVFVIRNRCCAEKRFNLGSSSHRSTKPISFHSCRVVAVGRYESPGGLRTGSLLVLVCNQRCVAVCSNSECMLTTVRREITGNCLPSPI